MAAILGISAYFHDSAAALIVDGAIVAAAQEERFTRRKHDPAFPAQAAAYCLRAAGLDAAQLGAIAFYEKPLLKFDRLLETWLAFAPAGFPSFRLALPAWLKDKLHLRRRLRRALPGTEKTPLLFPEHHESHAASAFFPSPYERAAILTIDGVGEWSTATSGTGAKHTLRLTQHLQFPHSLGLLYSAFTHYCGFRVNSGEYKLMGLAPYGEPRFRDTILTHLIDLKADGSFWMDLRYFDYCGGLTMTNARFAALFGGPARQPEARLEKRHLDLAASMQAVAEETVLRIAREVHRQTGEKNLVLAGGVALNAVANGRLRREGPFENVWIQPAAGDAGGALGAALFAWHQLMEKPRTVQPADSMQGSLLGPQFSSGDIARGLATTALPHEHFADENALLAEVARLLAAGKTVGWFHGRAEFGPRALGARSILADARAATMQSTLNVQIKFRESFRPFAPCVLRERAGEWFALPPGEESPYMLLVAPLLERHRVKRSDAAPRTQTDDPDLQRRAGLVRSTLPAVTHVDFSARLQTVDEPRHGRFCRLLRAFERLTGCPVLINTSFNIRGEPIVGTPEDACRCFLATGLDVLVLEDFLLRKERLDPAVTAAARAAPRAPFAPD